MGYELIDICTMEDLLHNEADANIVGPLWLSKLGFMDNYDRVAGAT